ncbi:MAG: hypothetical protein J6S67_22150 [Methanobrevibacter sp.]|nr:hypothetical protein [Methanobrevibacter sp.]
MKYYLFAILDNIKTVAEVLSIAGGIITTFWLIFFIASKVDGDDDIYCFLKKIGFVWIPVYSIGLFSYVFLPNQKQMAFIIAAPYIVENQELRDATKNTAEIIKLGTEYLKDVLKPEDK